MSDLTQDTPDLLAQLFTPAYIQNPYPVLKQLREHAALIKVPDSQLWLATRYEDVSSILGTSASGMPTMNA